MSLNTYTVLSSTSGRTSEFGRYHAATPEEALAEANRDLAGLRASVLATEAFFGVFSSFRAPGPIVADAAHLWIDMPECSECPRLAEYEGVDDGKPYCAGCLTSDRAKAAAA